MSAFTARYRTTCPMCGTDVEPGQLAMWDAGEVVHATCDPTGRPLDPNPDVCPTCFMTRALNGSCDCEDT